MALPVCGYQGGKRLYAARVARELLAYRPTRIYDLGAGSGAVTLALLEAGFPAGRVTVVDAGPWGDFWRAVGRGEFRMERFAKLLRAAGQVPAKGVKGWLEDLATTLASSPEVFVLLQAAAVRGKPVWDSPRGWRVNPAAAVRGKPVWDSPRGWRVNPAAAPCAPGERYCAAPWRVARSRGRDQLRGTLPDPEGLLERVRQVLAAARGIDGRRELAERVAFAPGSAVYVDPPYAGTCGYGWGLDWRSIVARHRPVVVSEGVPLPGAARVERLDDRRKGVGKSRQEWLSFYE